jgi:hypothetical protein
VTTAYSHASGALSKLSALCDHRFKPVGGPIRRPSATNGGSTLRGDEESACARKLDNSQLSRKAPVELTPSQWMVTNSASCVRLLDFNRSEGVPGNSLHISFPKDSSNLLLKTKTALCS